MSKPLQGLSFCCTSIPTKERDVIVSRIQILGGNHFSDLMSDVKYLIVGDRNTEKYKFCVKFRNDIVFLQKNSINLLYNDWLNGESNLNVNNLKLNIFENLSICLSRIETNDSHNSILTKLPHRQTADFNLIYNLGSLSDIIIKNGGQVTNSLSKSTNFLVTTNRIGKKYNKSLEWKIPVLHPVFIFDSLLRRACLNPSDYLLNDIENSINLNGYKFWNQQPQPTSKTSIRKSNSIWNSIMNEENFRAASTTDENDWQEESLNLSPMKATVTEEPTKLTLFANLSFLVIGFNKNQLFLLKSVIHSHGGKTSDVTEEKNITHILLPFKNGHQSASMINLLNSELQVQLLQDKKIIVVTEWFIERCVFYNRIVDDNWGKPITGLIKADTKLKICVTGFTGIELLHLKNLINHLGFHFCESLTSSRDLLVININLFKSTLLNSSPQLFSYKYGDILDCPTYSNSSKSHDISLISSKNKINAAKKWNIPIVSIAYIWEMMVQTSTQNASVLVIPDILNLNWCLFAPKTSETDQTSVSPSVSSRTSISPSVSQSKFKPPSPRKLKKRQRYGKLFSNSESLTTKLLQLRDPQSSNNQVDTSFVEESPDLISYKDSANPNHQLLQKLSVPHNDSTSTH